MKANQRTWLAFGDLEIGQRFRFHYNALYSHLEIPARLSPDVLVKSSPRKYRYEHSAGEYQTSVSSAVRVEP